MGVVSILSAGADFGKARVLCLDGLGFSPLGETGEGLRWGGDDRMDVNVHAIGTKPAEADWNNYSKGNCSVLGG